MLITYQHDIYATFINNSHGTVQSFTLFISAKAITKLHLEHIDKTEIKILKISHRGSRSPNNIKFDHFTFLFWRDQHDIPATSRTSFFKILLNRRKTQCLNKRSHQRIESRVNVCDCMLVFPTGMSTLW